MEKLQAIKDLRRGLNELRELGAVLKKSLFDMGNAIDNEKFSTPDDLETWSMNLLAWMKKSNACIEIYKQIFEEPLPEKFSDLEKILEVEEKKIREASIFGQAEKFLLLVTEAPDLKKILREHQAALKKLLARKRQNEKLKAALAPYAKFINATEEADIGKKFSAGKELGENFSDDFLGRGLFGDELILSTPEEFAEKKIVHRRKTNEIPPPEPITPEKLFDTFDALLSEKDFDVWKKSFTIDDSERTKEFSSKNFRKEFNNPEMLKPVLRYTAAKGMLWLPGFCPKKMPVNVVESIAQMLLTRGYFKRYNFEKLGSFYGLTKNFIEFLRTDNGKKFISNSKHGEKFELDNMPFVTEDIKVALTRMLFFHIHKIAMENDEAFHDVDFSLQSFRTEFIGAKDRDLFIGLFWDAKEDIDKFFRRIKNYLKRGKKIDRVFVAGFNRTHAEKTFDIIEKFFGDD